MTTNSVRTGNQPTGALVRQRWPTLAGVALAVLTVYDLSSGRDLSAILAASGLVYLGAAALKRPATAWPVFFGAFVVITATKLGPDLVDGTWIILGLAAVFLVYGLLRGALRPTAGLPLQTIAMLGFGGAAAGALLVDETFGAYLVAAGLLGHAAWDVYHHRANIVVARSMAEFCFVLDTLIAIAIVVVTVRS
jgi:hypothetical protein